MNAAALIAALATSKSDKRSGLTQLWERQTDLLTDLLHDFAFKARKYIELVGRQGVGAIERASRKTSIGISPRERDNLRNPLPDGYSIWFVLGRVIHSDSFKVEWGQVPLQVGESLVHHRAPWAFSVRSDRDGETDTHFIYIEFLLQAFLSLDSDLQDQLRFKAAGVV